jgi:hypothetical protein
MMGQGVRSDLLLRASSIGIVANNLALTLPLPNELGRGVISIDL